jgi:ATP adenylyltransferase
MLERIWSGWRASYVSSVPAPGSASALSDASPESSSGSVFTRILHSGLDDIETHIVHRGAAVFAILNAYPYGTGHLLVLPYREIADLEALDAAEAGELWATVTQAVQALKTAYRPEGINVGINLGRPAGGSVSEHLHVHVLPRWTGDANFMTSIANTRTLPEPLDETAARVRSAWPVPLA